MALIESPVLSTLAVPVKCSAGIAVTQRCRPFFWSRWAGLENSFSGDETGSELVEFALVILPLMAFVFLIMDIAWICFAQASLQHAVQVGVRSAVTSYMPTGVSGQDGYIKSMVQQNAMGFLAGTDGLNRITINYYSPSNLNKALSGSGSNAGGNVIEVSVKGVTVNVLGPILIDSATISMAAISSDVMESSPNGIPPTR